jgi:hypothetical protein
MKCRQNDILPSKAKYFPSNVLASVQHNQHLFLAKKSDKLAMMNPDAQEQREDMVEA